MIKDFQEKKLAAWFDALEQRILSRSPNPVKYIVGDTLTIADLVLGALAFTHLFNDNSSKQKDLLPTLENRNPTLLMYFRGLGVEF